MSEMAGEELGFGGCLVRCGVLCAVVCGVWD